MEHLSQFIINHWQLWLGFLIILLLTLLNEFLMQKKKMSDLSPEAAIDLINNKNAVVIDIRDKESFKKGHIIDSINIASEEFETPKMNQYKNKSLILVCVKGIRAKAVADKIRTQGYQALVLSGGISAWQEADLPLVKGE